MRLRRKKPAAFYGPHPEPGLYVCAGCHWAFINFGHDWWQGPIYPGPAEGPARIVQTISTGRSMIWDDLENGYADCVSRLERK